MPPVAVSVGLMVALAGPVCLAAQTLSPAEATPLASETRASQSGDRRFDQADRELRAVTSPQQGLVVPAAFQSESASRSPLGGDPPIPFKPRSRSSTPEEGIGSGRAGGLVSLVTVGSSLAVVLGLFFVVAWTMRRTIPGASAVLPSEVVEVLGRAALAGRAQVHLVRCGNKLLLVSASPTGVETLTEITDPDEVNRLAGLCRRAEPGSATAAFRQVLQQLAGDRTTSGRLGTGSEDVDLANAGVRRTDDKRLEGRDV